MKRQSNERRNDAKQPPITEVEARRFEQAMAYLRKNFRTATLKDVAAAADVSMFHFHRRFTLWAGRTPKDVITELQLEHARALLANGGVELRDIAEDCGFASQSHFTGRFHSIVGETPGRWRRARLVEALDGDASLPAKRKTAA